MEFWPKDVWSVCSRPAGVIYAGCILAVLALYAYTNRIAPVAGFVSLVILALVFAAFANLAGNSDQTWTDPSNALALLLIACALLLDGFFIAGASTFGPTKVLDVDIGSLYAGDAYVWNDGHWIDVNPPNQMAFFDEWERVQSRCRNLKLTTDLEGRLEISMWDRQVHRITITTWTPPTTIGEPRRPNIRAFVELALGLVLLILAFIVRREGHRRGIRHRGYDRLLGDELRR